MAGLAQRAARRQRATTANTGQVDDAGIGRGPLRRILVDRAIVEAVATATDYPISGLVLQDGSALVAANFKFTLTYQRTVAGATMNLGGKTATMRADGTTVEGTATAEYLATILMRIPSKTAGGIPQIVGGEYAIVSVTLDPSSSPG